LFVHAAAGWGAAACWKRALFSRDPCVRPAAGARKAICRACCQTLARCTGCWWSTSASQTVLVGFPRLPLFLLAWRCRHLLLCCPAAARHAPCGSPGLARPADCIKVLTDDQKDRFRRPTRHNIRRGCEWLTKDVRRGDSLFFHFSGEGWGWLMVLGGGWLWQQALPAFRHVRRLSVKCFWGSSAHGGLPILPPSRSGIEWRLSCRAAAQATATRMKTPLSPGGVRSPSAPAITARRV
jgi:hypothetical protein